jgi:small subunit ribosomal protein S17
MEAERSQRRTLQGTVTSAATAQTITVQVERTFRHARYGKYMSKRKKYAAHDEKSEARRGDLVEIAATRPLSKRKRWRLLRVVRRADLVSEIPDVETEIASAGGAVTEGAATGGAS